MNYNYDEYCDEYGVEPECEDCVNFDHNKNLCTSGIDCSYMSEFESKY